MSGDKTRYVVGFLIDSHVKASGTHEELAAHGGEDSGGNEVIRRLRTWLEERRRRPHPPQKSRPVVIEWFNVRRCRSCPR